MFNPLKTSTRIKVVISVIVALLISFLFIQPKQNDIPVTAVSLQLDVTQELDSVLILDTIDLVQAYAPDYQTDLLSNYYLIEMKKGQEVLFSGKTPKSRITIDEWLVGEPRNEVVEERLGSFSLLLPYVSQATNIVVTDDKGNEALYVDLSSLELEKPERVKTCGDGVCTDNENLLMCYTDCKYLLPLVSK